MTQTTVLPEKRKKIWHWGLIAGWIAAILAVLASVGAYVNAPAPDGTPQGGAALAGYIIGYCAAAAVLAAVITWAIFAMTVFLRRGSIIKSLVVLAIMIPAAFAVAAPLSFLAMFGHFARRDEQIEHWNQEAAQRVRALAQTLDQQVAEAGDISLGHLQRQSDVDVRLARSQRVLALCETYNLRLEQELDAARERVADMDLTEPERQALLQQSEQHVFAGLREAAALNVEAAQHRVNMASLLRDESGKWTIQDGRVAFYDEALMLRMQSMAREHDAIIARLNELRPSAPVADPPRQ